MCTAAATCAPHFGLVGTVRDGGWEAVAGRSHHGDYPGARLSVSWTACNTMSCHRHVWRAGHQMPDRVVSGARPQLWPTEPLAPFCRASYAHEALVVMALPVRCPALANIERRSVRAVSARDGGC